jgi:hypothetical protein
MDRYRAALLFSVATFLVFKIGGGIYAGDPDSPVASDQITMNFHNVDIPV